MGIKELFGGNKGVDCQEDENGVKVCRVINKHKNSLLATGSSFEVAVDKSCKAHIVGRSTILNEDEAEVRKALKQIESDCRGGIN